MLRAQSHGPDSSAVIRPKSGAQVPNQPLGSCTVSIQTKTKGPKMQSPREIATGQRNAAQSRTKQKQTAQSRLHHQNSFLCFVPLFSSFFYFLFFLSVFSFFSFSFSFFFFFFSSSTNTTILLFLYAKYQKPITTSKTKTSKNRVIKKRQGIVWIENMHESEAGQGSETANAKGCWSICTMGAGEEQKGIV